MEFFWNAFWVFIGIVAGALIQYGFYWLTQRSQQSNAKKIFLAEIIINRIELENVKKDIIRKKERFAARQIEESDFFFDFRGFNYRIVDPLINSGHFHKFMGPEGVAKYFKFMNELNYVTAERLQLELKAKHEIGKSLDYLDKLIDTDLVRWSGALDYAESRTN